MADTRRAGVAHGETGSRGASAARVRGGQRRDPENDDAARPWWRRLSSLASTVFVVAALALALALNGQIHWPRHPTGPVSFAITAPGDGAVVSDPVHLAVAVHGVEIGLPVTGKDHLHVWVDGGSERAIYRNRVLDLDLAPGPHTVDVQLAAPNHAAVKPPQRISFTVR